MRLQLVLPLTAALHSIASLTVKIIFIRIILRTTRFPSYICQSAGTAGWRSKPQQVRRTVGIHEIHMEEDAGKLVHDEWEDCSIWSTTTVPAYR